MGRTPGLKEEVQTSYPESLLSSLGILASRTDLRVIITWANKWPKNKVIPLGELYSKIKKEDRIPYSSFHRSCHTLCTLGFGTLIQSKSNKGIISSMVLTQQGREALPEMARLELALRKKKGWKCGSETSLFV